MKNDDMLFDVNAMTEELDRTLRHLENRDPVPSQINIGFSLPGMKSDTWLTEQLREALLLLVTKDGGGSIRPFWGEDDAPEGYTSVNLTDFILACTQDAAIACELDPVIIHVALSAWKDIHPTYEVGQGRLRNIIGDILYDNKEAEKGSPAEQRAEYQRIIQSLIQRNPVPSRVQCLFGFDEDATAGEWTKKRVIDTLYILQNAEEDDCFSTCWTPEGQRLSYEEGKRVFPTMDKGSVINLTDFLLACCKHKKVVSGREGMALAMFVMFIFKDISTGDMMVTLKKIMADFAKIHKALKTPR